MRFHRTAALTLLALATVARAQAVSPRSAVPEPLDNGLRVVFVPVPKANRVSIALAVPTGWQHDPTGRTGCAELLRWSFTLAQRDLPLAEQLTVQVQPHLTLFSHTGPTRGAVDRLAFLETLLAGRLELSDDVCALAKGRARLEADNHAWLYPGSVLRQKAWRVLLAGTPGGRRSLGIPGEIAAVGAGDLRRWYEEHYGCSGACLVVAGGLSPEVWKEARTRLEALPTGVGSRPAPVVHDAAPPVERDGQHRRIDGPYATATVPGLTPSHPDFLAFVTAILVLRNQAYREFGGPRGPEWRAHCSYVDYRYWEDDPLVRINRRGPDGVVPTVPRDEIRALLDRVRRRGVSRALLDGTRLQVARTLATPPFADRAGGVLAMRARYVATALCRGWPLDLATRVGFVTKADVDRVLREHFAPPRLTWFSLRPVPRSGVKTVR